MNILKDYDKQYRCLKDSDIVIDVKYLNDFDIVICYSSNELDLDKHIHCGNLNEGIKGVIENCLEALIWKIEDEKGVIE